MNAQVVPGASALVLGVLNVTPDSFSDGGQHDTIDRAIAHGNALLAAGADIVDVGGESTRPGALAVAGEEERRRVLPVIEKLSRAGASVSVDTIHADTAAAAVAAGARYINDVSGGTHDPDMLQVAAEASRSHGTRFIIGHWRGVPDPAHVRSEYRDVVAEVRDALAELAAAAMDAGVAREHIVLDPGLGFDKTGAQCWSILGRLDALTSLGFPVLIGASRKRMLAEVLAQVPSPGEGTAGLLPRSAFAHPGDLATAIVSAFSARAGAWGVRVHDVAGTVQALAVERAWQCGKASADVSADAAELADAALERAEERVSPMTPGLPADRITLTGLEVFAHHGVFDFERERGQRFLIDAELAVNLRPAAAGDALSRTVHYGELAEAIVAAVERDPVDLIETVAERVASVALSFAGVSSATITVHKPEAPIAAQFTDVSVSVTRRPTTREASSPAASSEPTERAEQ